MSPAALENAFDHDSHLVGAEGCADLEIADANLAALAQRTLVMLRADGVAIALRKEQQMLCCATAGDLAPAVGIAVREDSGLAGECIRTGGTVACADTTRDPRVNSSTVSSGISSVLVTPITTGDAVVGIIEAMSAATHAFGDREQRSLESLANGLIGRFRPQAAATRPLTLGPSSRAIADVPAFLTIDTSAAGEPHRWWWGIPITLIATLAIAVSIHSGTHAERFVTPVAETSVVNQRLIDSLQRSADQGNIGAQSALATFYWTGRGVPQDDIAACMWSLIAAASGDRNSKQRVDLLRASMSTANMQLATQRANQWMAQHTTSNQAK